MRASEQAVELLADATEQLKPYGEPGFRWVPAEIPEEKKPWLTI